MLYLLTSDYSFQVFSFARYDPSLSFSTEHWFDILPSKQLDPLKEKQIILQVLIARESYIILNPLHSNTSMHILHTVL